MEESTRRSSDAEDVEDDDGDEFEDDELDDESDESESSEGEGEAAGEAEEKVDGEPPMGCKHYNRGAKIVAPCCGGVFWCRLCHDVEKDEGEADPRKQHKINRFAIAECVCAQCGLRQEVRQTCAGCGLVMGAYFCKTCKFWENKARGQFHCDECGMCRIGGKENYRHCSRCGGCFPISDDSHQVCIADAMKSTCPVCLEDLAVSVVSSQRMACGHMIHCKCLKQLLRTTYKCPLCSMSIVDMRSVFAALEMEISLTPMPEEYAHMSKHILCNDCHQESNTRFHVLGLKCLNCNSFNTREVAGEASVVSGGSGSDDTHEAPK